jgi:ACS family glucarate transporter-like MFS transporter
VRERGLVTGINFSASRLGGAAALPLMVWLIEAAGWRGAFFILGGIGVVFAVFWYVVFRDDPEDHPLVSEEEKNYIHQNRQQIAPGARRTLPFGEIVASKQTWLAMLQYFCSNFTFFFCLTWLYPHVKETYQLTASEAGFLAAVPLLGGAAGNWFSGWWVDRLFVAKGLVASRRTPAVLGFALAAAGLLVSLQMESEFGAIAFLTIAVFGADMTLSPSWSFCVDIGGSSAGAVSGTMNMAGNLGSFATALAFPYLKDAFESVEPFFYIGAALNIAAMFVWMRMDSRHTLGKPG